MGLVGPNKSPVNFGMRTSDYHIVVNDESEKAKIYKGTGELLTFKNIPGTTKEGFLPCLARGVGGDDWRVTYGDTTPGLYKFRSIIRDYETAGGMNATYNEDRRAYGWYSFFLTDLEKVGGTRGANVGIMAHGGGGNWGNAWNPLQTLYKTLGCVRFHNQHLRDIIVPIYEKGAIFMSVWQDDYK